MSSPLGWNQNYDLDASDPVPYRCTSCARLGMSRRQRPQCCGVDHDLHPPAAMERVDERDISLGDVQALVLK